MKDGKLSNTEQRQIATLNMAHANPEYVDLSFYEKLQDATSLKAIDYFLARVTSNPSLSNNFTREIYESSHPTFNKFCSLGDSIEVPNTGLCRNDVTSQTVVDNTSNQQLIFDRSVDDIVSSINEEEDPLRLNMLKVFAFFLVSSGNMKVTHPALETYLQHFKSVDTCEFYRLIDLIGARYSAEKARARFREIYKNYLNR